VADKPRGTSEGELLTHFSKGASFRPEGERIVRTTLLGRKEGGGSYSGALFDSSPWLKKVPMGRKERRNPIFRGGRGEKKFVFESIFSGKPPS